MGMVEKLTILEPHFDGATLDISVGDETNGADPEADDGSNSQLVGRFLLAAALVLVIAVVAGVARHKLRS